VKEVQGLDITHSKSQTSLASLVGDSSIYCTL